ncbi:hypothetical protein DLAC_02704 [Tieghemostelium lacteum]|uniref:Uncharacterized protein n=1 Tax=Tieghemostelium lacteum TaxID=361077 RepID=A0A152A380_TIELA|nr:hypothetical protein DLAC_02704 [Tieghemostelium lacteum]|eukprot:KYR00670.1 hypothetical protein DLAC_02704 [Tieghemostelium lacteum]
MRMSKDPNILTSLKEVLPKFVITFPEFDILLNNQPINQNNSSQTFQDDEDEFTVIDNINNDYFNNSGGSGGGGINSNSISPSVSKKYHQELEKSLSELKMQESQKIKALEHKLQSTFLMASKSEEKYKDLLEKSKIQQLQQQLDQTDKIAIADLRQSLEKKNLEINKLNEQLQLLANKSSENLNQIDELQSQKYELGNTTKSLLDDINQIKQVRERLELDYQDSQEQIQEKEEKIHSLEGRISILENELSQIDTLKNTIETLEKEIEKYNQMIDEKYMESSHVRENADKMLSEMKQLSEQIQVKENEMKKFEKEKSDIDDKYQLKIAELMGQIVDLQELTSEQSEKMSSMSDKIKEYDSKVDEQNNTIQKLRNEVLDLESEMKRQKTTADYHQESAMFVGSQLEKLKEELLSKQQTIIELNSRSQHADTVASNRDKIIKEQFEKENNLEKTVQELEKNIKALNVQLTLTVDDNKFINEQLNLRNEQFKESKFQTAKQAITIKEQDKEISKMGSRIIELQQILSENEEENKAYHLSVEKDIEEKEKQIMELYKQIKQKENQIEVGKEYQHILYNLSRMIQPTSQGMLDKSLLYKAFNEIQIHKDTSISLEQSLEQQSNLNEVLKKKITQLETANLELHMNRDQPQPHRDHPKETNNDNNALFTNFSHSRNAIFCLNPQYYEAVNINAPNYFLSPLCYDHFEKEIKLKKPIIGVIFEIETKIAGTTDSFGLPPGTEFHEVLLGRIN